MKNLEEGLGSITLDERREGGRYEERHMDMTKR